MRFLSGLKEGEKICVFDVDNIFIELRKTEKNLMSAVLFGAGVTSMLANVVMRG